MRKIRMEKEDAQPVGILFTEWVDELILAAGYSDKLYLDEE